jgi:serine/threonine protein phosphatase PrpC
METFFQTVAGNPENQDRGAVIESGSKRILVIADGAGGLAGGAEAAAMAVDLVRKHISTLDGRILA